ncbi:para-aminobenzoate synthase, subunit I [Chloroherpeton thalassium ATCC 35110]|uniref:Para-aminobenzoate synthase, subunit I n=1 Tax=Chloroherpeton thalassium (strain ATCC 35110 / GB-78) TaxID=517418 RepID=B3QY32_CHLT3|nr:aminodeoxychorismate synthase component I [Chloroherpeton thalassium]ACF14998.1 para-aminobenzoate synthase, subunit I [Chloroherpeton thalassium ATCC 35110]
MHYPLPAEFYRTLSSPNALLLETAKFDKENFQSYLFVNPSRILTLTATSDIRDFFAQIDDALNARFFAAGYFSYEAGYLFEPEIFSRELSSVPNRALAWIGIYERPYVFNHRTGKLSGKCEIPNIKEHSNQDFTYQISEPAFDINEPIYAEKIDEIKCFIASGDVYQINFTGKFGFDFSGDAVSFYRKLKESQPVAYGAYLNTGAEKTLSFSPELFFRIRDGKISVRPMKGTVGRGRTREEDAAQRAWLGEDVKNRAENLMITDLLRNDLGRICKKGSVCVSELFQVETFRSLHQMTSAVQAELPETLSIYDLFKAIFPCGSVTGAPKIRAMQLIHALENAPRGIYTGAIGFFSPTREAVFNVAIRTLTLNGERGKMGSGSGIVWDSDARAEYAECRLKSEFLNAKVGRFALIESMLWENGVCALLDDHFARLADSAVYFGIECDSAQLRRQLENEAKSHDENRSYKVRLTLDIYGKVKIERAEIASGTSGELKVCLSKSRTNSADRLLFHKTTERGLYDRLFAKATAKGFADVLFFNEKDELTEGAISNVFLKKNGRFFTPPIDCGLLAGVYRTRFLRQHPDTVEKPLTLNDLEKCDEIYLSNAVRGLRKVKLEKIYLEDEELTHPEA